MTTDADLFLSRVMPEPTTGEAEYACGLHWFGRAVVAAGLLVAVGLGAGAMWVAWRIAEAVTQ